MIIDLKGKKALVTGASRGIGKMCAIALARAGAGVTVGYHRKEQEAADTVRQVAECGQEATAFSADVADAAQVENLVQHHQEVHGRLDILVNNAGLARGLAPVHEGDVADWDEMIDTNVKGLLNVTRTIVRGMVDRGEGHVINIGSIAGHETYANGVVYCATKHAVAAITRGLGIDTLGTGVRVSSVDPGLVNTEFSVVRFHGDQERADGVYAGMTPLSARDVADAVLFCASRPAHANVREMVLMPADQAAAVYVHRDENR